MSARKSTHLLLIGKTGNGKSATGNSILLKENAFKCNDFVTSATIGVHTEVSEFLDRTIKVIDVPGVDADRLDLVLETITSAIAANPEGFDAFLLVVKLCDRFTKEGIDTIAILKDVFGGEFVRDYCILVMTYGDLFDTNNKKTGKSFPNWCKEQTGTFKDLLTECNNRIVLFDNITEDERKQKEQVTELLHIVDNLNSGGQRYTDENFKMAQRTRDRIMIEARIPMIKKETIQEIEIIMTKLKAIREEEDLKSNLKELYKLQGRVECCLHTITLRDKETNALHGLFTRVEFIKINVDAQIISYEKLKAEKKLNKESVKEIQKGHKEELRTQRVEVEKEYILRRKYEDMLRNEKEQLEAKYKKQMLEDRENMKRDFKETEAKIRRIKIENDEKIKQSCIIL